MRRYFFYITLALSILSFTSSVQAQEAGGLGGYVPPPLFGTQQGTPEPVEVEKQQKPAIILQPNKAQPTTKQSEPLIKGSADIKDNGTKSEQAAPTKIDTSKIEARKVKPIIKNVKPPRKPKPPQNAAPQIVKAKSINKPVQSGPEPIDLLKKKDIPPPPSIKADVKKDKPKVVIEKIDPPKVTSEGVVKGPKTMPSNKKQAVDSLVTFDNKAVSPSILMERVQEDVKQSAPENIKTDEEIARIKEKIPLPSFVKQDDGGKKVPMLYLEKQSELKDAQINILEQMIVPELEEHTGKRLIIQAYANSPDDSLNSDRRLALDRALAVRDYVLKQNIDSNRMDVRALGAQTNVQPLDRVELYITP